MENNMKFNDYLNEKLKDPEFRKEWDDIQPEIEKVMKSPLPCGTLVPMEVVSKN